jgi:putative transposase
MAVHVRRAFKYRFSPTDAQAVELSRTFGCVRKVYNLTLAARTEAWARQERVNYHQTSAMLTAWEKTEELTYLNKVSCVPLQQALRHLQTAFTHFFAKRAMYPCFRSRKQLRKSAEDTTSAFRFREGRPALAKMAEPLDIVRSRPLPEGASPSTVTVSQDAAGRRFVSLLCEDPSLQPLPATDSAVGIGLDHLLTLSTGRKVTNPRHESRDRARLAKAQRQLARKTRANRARARRKVAKIHARIIRSMVKNGSLARAAGDAAWSEFRSMLEYKAQWYGREVIAIDRWFPSSELCSGCGSVQDEMPLPVREWTCGCGTVRDRDVNAAKNILAVGLTASACGAGVGPQRSTPGGQSVMRQKTPRREP